MEFVVSRDCDTLRLRKVVVELCHEGNVLDKTRMFGWPLFAKRVEWRKKRMYKMALKMLAASGSVPSPVSKKKA